MTQAEKNILTSQVYDVMTESNKNNLNYILKNKNAIYHHNAENTNAVINMEEGAVNFKMVPRKDLSPKQRSQRSK